jgi:hypothetical protein
MKFCQNYLTGLEGIVYKIFFCLAVSKTEYSEFDVNCVFYLLSVGNVFPISVQRGVFYMRAVLLVLLHVNCPTFLSDFNKNSNVLTENRKGNLISNFMRNGYTIL